MHTNLTQMTLKQILHYDSDTGIFTWKIQPNSRVFEGDVAGTPDKDGYIIIGIGRTKYRAHRLAWLYENGVWPDGLVDHRNLNRADNRIDNLREASYSESLINRRVQGNNKTGIKGVILWKNNHGNWYARGQCEKRGKKPVRRSFSVLRFGEEEALRLATEFASQAREAHHGEFANHG